LLDKSTFNTDRRQSRAVATVEATEATASVRGNCLGKNLAEVIFCFAVVA